MHLYHSPPPPPNRKKLKRPSFKSFGKKNKKERSSFESITMEPTIESCAKGNKIIMNDHVEAGETYVARAEEERHPTNESRSPPSDDESIWTGLTDDVNISNVSTDRSTSKEGSSNEDPLWSPPTTPTTTCSEDSAAEHMVDERPTLDITITKERNVSSVNSSAFCGLFSLSW